MVAMSAGVTLETAATGGLLKSLGRALLGGESFFQNTYRAPAGGGELMVAPALPGDLSVLRLENESLMVQSGSYVASELAIATSIPSGAAPRLFLPPKG
jgi:uncharacterized protein (AIM24 family)